MHLTLRDKGCFQCVSKLQFAILAELECKNIDSCLRFLGNKIN